MIVCIFGPSCVGKTTVASRAAAALGFPMRSCGDAVREKAEALGLPIDQLEDDTHRAIDAATVEWALESRGGCVIDGRFLDAVFAAAGVSVILIELQAGRNCRVKRARLRRRQPTFSNDDLDRLDGEDANFRARHFLQHTNNQRRYVFDTSGLTVDECSRRVQEIVKGTSLCQKS